MSVEVRCAHGCWDVDLCEVCSPNLIEAGRNHEMSAEEKEEQRRRFAHGNVALHNPAVTREVIDRSAESASIKRPDHTKVYLGGDFLERVAKLEKLVEAADYLQHCRRRQDQYLGYGLASAKKSVERASDHYDFLRGQVKL